MKKNEIQTSLFDFWSNENNPFDVLLPSILVSIVAMDWFVQSCKQRYIGNPLFSVAFNAAKFWQMVKFGFYWHDFLTTLFFMGKIL